MENSARGGAVGPMGFPFGYLKPSTNMQTVSLFVMPYNYPVILPLLEESRDPKVAASSSFRQRLDRYLMSVPQYYFSVRTAF